MTYPDLVTFCGGNERQAWCLAQKLPTYREMTEPELEQAVLDLLVKVAERSQRGNVQLQLTYEGGERRDTIRGHY
jgi:hypothetical protein